MTICSPTIWTILGTLMGRIRVSGGRSLGKTESDDKQSLSSTVTAMLESQQGRMTYAAKIPQSIYAFYMEELVTALIALRSPGCKSRLTRYGSYFCSSIRCRLTHMDCWYEYVETKSPVNSSTVSDSSKEWLALWIRFA
jgi:hypothetical protein